MLKNIGQTLLVITGPTATGKTALSVELARRINGEIISADSMLIYKYMDIGTAKPTLEERQGVPHYMIDIIEPDQEYSVALYQQEVEKIIPAILARGRVPMLVGGTGLYIRSVVAGFHCSQIGKDEAFRQEMQQLARENGNIYLHEMLARVDPPTANRLHPNDQKRVIRALEVYHLSGKPFSWHNQPQNNRATPYRILQWGLTLDRELLYQRINRRVDEMLQKGLVQEVRWLLEQGYSPTLTSMQGLGYKEIAAYLNGQISLPLAVETLKRNTRRFAKRQLTWFRRDPAIKWLDVNSEPETLVLQITRDLAGLSPGM
ncbi:MAG: tRNA (adenosine(37)-N6)-dimethylallyltransferase MiaA [Bacillota bacterium]|uniref:tRNA (adenosine(37)-N6)-dimethylallyltransferase MiaA n=1 Tax=Desulfurispora thermophila TaxID=265470 RepID=UPI000369DB73|nr:tRNA (adenosine(37)-N6)-dimethylallyltransferase MiaA [Desulfurispora thermophila]